jgi:hypothetical protein
VPILLKDGIKYLPRKVKEEELEDTVFRLSKHIFGDGTLIFPGRRIGERLKGKWAKGIPDGFLIDIRNKQWYIIEIELSSHDPDTHIIPQLNRFSKAYKDHESLTRLKDEFTAHIRNNIILLDAMRRFCSGTNEFEFVSKVLDKVPALLIIADEITTNLREACDNLIFSKRFISLEIYNREGITETVPVYRFEPLEYTQQSTPSGHVSASTRRRGSTKVIRQLHFLDKSVEFHYSKEIPVIIANELINRGLLVESMIPCGPGRNKYFISRTSKHPTGKEFRAAVKLVNGWYIDTHASEKYTIFRSKKLMERTGIKNPTIRIT